MLSGALQVTRLKVNRKLNEIRRKMKIKGKEKKLEEFLSEVVVLHLTAVGARRNDSK